MAFNIILIDQKIKNDDVDTHAKKTGVRLVVSFFLRLGAARCVRTLQGKRTFI